MPLPATHLQPVQAAVKMVTAPDLSLRGRFAPVAISGRHLQSVQGVDKTHGPIASVAALSERHWQSQIWRHSWRTYNALKLVIARPRRGRGNLGKAVTISPMAFPRSSRILRDCHVGLWPPRNDTSGSMALRTVLPIESAVLLPLRGRLRLSSPLHSSAYRAMPPGVCPAAAFNIRTFSASPAGRPSSRARPWFPQTRWRARCRPAPARAAAGARPRSGTRVSAETR